MLIAYPDDGILDVPAMETGRLMHCEPLDREYGKESVPAGIDLSGGISADSRAYTAPGASALAPHPEQIKAFPAYLFENNGGFGNE